MLVKRISGQTRNEPRSMSRSTQIMMAGLLLTAVVVFAQVAAR